MENNEKELYKEETTEVITEYDNNDSENNNIDEDDYKNILDDMIEEFSLNGYLIDEPNYDIQYYQILSKVMINEYKNAKDNMKNYKIVASLFLLLFVVLMILIMVSIIMIEVI